MGRDEKTGVQAKQENDHSSRPDRKLAPVVGSVPQLGERDAAIPLIPNDAKRMAYTVRRMD